MSNSITDREIKAGTLPFQRCRTKIIGHRGCAGLLPENSLSACQKAIELGLQGIEIDIQLSADEEIIVYHNLNIQHEYSRYEDRWLKKVGPALNSLTLHELQKYDISRIKRWTLYWLKRRLQKATSQERIPTLRQIFELVRDKAPKDFKIWIEMKTNPLLPVLSSEPIKMANKVLELIQEFNFQNQIVLLSFDWRGFRHIQTIAPDICCALLTDERRKNDTVYRRRTEDSPWLAGHNIRLYGGSIPKMIKAAGGHCWATSFKGLTFQAVQEAQRLGLEVYVWTVNSKFMMKRLKNWEVDGIITDFPNRWIELNFIRDEKNLHREAIEHMK